MPALAMVGMNGFQLGHGEGNDRDFNNWRDPKTGNTMMFAFQVGVRVCGVQQSQL